MLLNCDTGQDPEVPLDSKIKPVNLKEINFKHSLERLMLKLKLQYFGHLVWRINSLEKTLILGKIERRRTGWQRMRWFISVTQLCLTLCDPMDCNLPSFPVHHQRPELAQTHVHSIGDAIQPSHPLSSPSSPTFHLSQHQGLFQRVSSSHQVARVLELQHQSFQWIFRTDFL